MAEKKISTRPPGHKASKRSAAEPGTAPSPSALGNRTLSRLLASGPVRVSQPGDPQEKEAERLAGAVTSAGHPPEEERAALPSVPASATSLGPGRPLDPAARAMLEPRFGRDLGAVRVHDGPEAAEAAQAVEARAFTVGRDVVFAPGQYAPGTPGGTRLLAHELAHVVQPSSAGGQPVIQRSPWDVKRPEPQQDAPAQVPPQIVEIRPEELIASLNPKISRIAGQAKASLRLSQTAVVQVDAFWDLSSNPAVQGAGVRPAEAKQRAELVKAALVELGVPANRIVTGTLGSNVQSDPTASPGGLVRIAFYPKGRPAELLPGLPQPLMTLRAPGGPPLVSSPQLRLPGIPPAKTQAAGGPDQEPESRQGEAGDVVKAFLSLPAVEKELDRAKKQALEEWKALKPGGKAGLITGAASLTAGALTGLAKNPALAKDLLKKLDGVEIPLPIPGVPGKLKLQILTNDEMPKFDPFAPATPAKLEKPVGPGAVLKWEIKF